MGPLVFGVAKTEHIVQGKPFTDYFVGLEWKAGMVFASLLRRQPGTPSKIRGDFVVYGGMPSDAGGAP